jgi:hypothetical protein
VNFCSSVHKNLSQDSMRLYFPSLHKYILILLAIFLSCPTTRHGGALGERRYSSYSFLTSALDGGVWSVSRSHHALPQEKGPPVPIGQEAGWGPELGWMQGLEEKSSAFVRDRTLVVQSIVSHYTAWAAPAPCIIFPTVYFPLSHFLRRK